MTDINFVEIDSQKIYEELINDFETAYGGTLYPGDERRIFLQQMVPIIVGLLNKINDSAKQNLLRYARDNILDAVAEDFFNTPRLKANKSQCQGKVKLVSPQSNDIPIPAGNRITPDGSLFFVIKDTVIIPAGESEGTVNFEAIEPGSKYNNLLAGQIKNIVDPIPFVESIFNIETSKGGSDIEENDNYRERSRLAPKSLSTAGPSGAYEYFARSADSSIVDVKTTSPSPGVVQIITLLKNGEIPSKIILDKVYAECSPRDRRPLTDKVEVTTPNIINYDIDVIYYLDKEHKEEEIKFRRYIEGDNLDCSSGAIKDFINCQQERLGKAIIPDELRYKIQNAATYKSNGKIHTAVRRIIVNAPLYTVIKDIEVAKVGSIKVTYGGLE